MPFPGIFRKLFENSGAGPRLLKAILPFHADTHGAQGSDPITPESIGAMAANAKPGSASSADVAVKLKTSRAIDGMGFDGTRSIIHYAVCSTAAATAAKTVNLTGFVLEIGARILVRFDTTNTAVSPTLNVNGTGAKAIRYKNATVTASVLAAKSIREFVYDGAYWQIVGDLDTNTTYGVFTKATASAAGKAGLVPAPGAGKQDAFLRGDGTWEILNGFMPVGGVAMFSGSFGGTGSRFPIDGKTKEVRQDWCLCDGTTTNGLPVPDLRGRMIIGVSSTYKAGSTGGAATHTHSVSGTVGATTLTEAQLAAHKHTHTVTSSEWGPSGLSGQDAHLIFPTEDTGTAGLSASHAHSLAGVKSGSASSLPPYYALAYIMRCA